MNDGAPFEAKLQEHLLAVQAAAQAAKARVADGIAGLAPRSEPPAAPSGGINPRSVVNFDDQTGSAELPPFDPVDSDISDGAGMDDEGIPVWEDAN